MRTGNTNTDQPRIVRRLKRSRMILGMPVMLAVAAFFPVAPTQAVVVNVDIQNNGSTLYTDTAVAPDPGTNWNGFNVTGGTFFQSLSNLVSSTGTPTGDSFTMSCPGSFNPQGYPAQIGTPAAASSLLNNYVWTGAGYNTGGEISFAIGGLTPGQQYDLYLYSQNAGQANNGSTRFTVTDPLLGTITADDITAGNVSSFAQNVNYVLFSSLTADNSGDISGSLGVLTGGNYAYLNGFQLATVPEPGAVMLFGIGSGLLWLRRRQE